MAVDPTPTSDHLERDSKEAVRGGTRTKFNLWVLVIGTLLVTLGLFGLFAMNSGDMGSTREDIGRTQQDAAVFDTTIEPAKGDTPVDGDNVTPESERKFPDQEPPQSN